MLRISSSALRPHHHSRGAEMIAAFSGLTAGSPVGLRPFGARLSAAILLEATTAGAILLPALGKPLGELVR